MSCAEIPVGSAKKRPIRTACQGARTSLHIPVEGTRLGRYVVRGALGRGGMGTVLEAFDPELDRPVALKVLHHELAQRHSTRLRREAQALARLSHPNVVQVYEVGEFQGQTFVAMELVHGQTLQEWMREEPRPIWQQCVEVFLQIGTGLVAAHEQGLVHRDFKPANAIIDHKGRARVLDFGLARRVDDLEPDEFSRKRTIGRGSRGRPAECRADQYRNGTGHSGLHATGADRKAGGRCSQRSVQLLRVALRGSVRRAPVRWHDHRRPDDLDDPRRHHSPEGNEGPGRGCAPCSCAGSPSSPAQRWPSMESLMGELLSLVAPRAGSMVDGGVGWGTDHGRRGTLATRRWGLAV